MKNEKTYTTPQVAEKLGVHYLTVIRWIAEHKVIPGNIHKFKKTRRFFFTEADVEAMRKWHEGE